MKIEIKIRSIRAYERLLNAGAGMALSFFDGSSVIYEDSHIARLPEAVRLLLDELKADGLVEMEPHTGSTGGRYVPTPEQAREAIRHIMRGHREGKITIEYFTHNGEDRFVYREQVPDAQQLRGTTGIYEYIGVIPPVIQQHGEEMIKWYVDKMAKADIAQQKIRDKIKDGRLVSEEWSNAEREAIEILDAMTQLPTQVKAKRQEI